MTTGAEIPTDLQDDLRTAMAIELTTIPPYLYAYWSIRTPVEGGSAAAEAVATIIRSVVMEEMLHMGLVANVLNAAGGRAALTTNVPEYPAHLFRPPARLSTSPGPGQPSQMVALSPSGIVVRLLPFGTEAKKLFMRIELPQWDASDRSNRIEYWDADVDTIGAFYDKVIIPKLKGPGVTYDPNGRRQLPSQDNPGAGKLIDVTSLSDALDAIELIKEQGEGTEKGPNDTFHELAHYYKFESIDLGALGAHDIYDVAADPKASDYSGAQLALNAAFNTTYSVLLDRLQQIVTSDDPDVFFDATGMMDELGHQAALLRNAGKVAGSGAMPGPTFDYLSPGQRQS
jgi:hypothetical protein